MALLSDKLFCLKSQRSRFHVHKVRILIIKTEDYAQNFGKDYLLVKLDFKFTF